MGWDRGDVGNEEDQTRRTQRRCGSRMRWNPKSSRPCLVATRAAHPQKWPTTSRNVADSCELTATSKQTEPSVSRGRAMKAEGCNARDAGRSGVQALLEWVDGLGPPRRGKRGGPSAAAGRACSGMTSNSTPAYDLRFEEYG